MNSRTAANRDWERDVSTHLSASEWPEGALEWMAARVVLTLSELRERVGAPLYPSPVLGGHVRHRSRRAGPGDRHATDDHRRLSDASDVFVRWPSAADYYSAAQSLPQIRGIGLYDAMRFRGPAGTYCMMHLDVPEPYEDAPRALWVGHGRDPVRYISQRYAPSEYYMLISQMLDRGDT